MTVGKVEKSQMPVNAQSSKALFHKNYYDPMLFGKNVNSTMLFLRFLIVHFDIPITSIHVFSKMDNNVS